MHGQGSAPLATCRGGLCLKDILPWRQGLVIGFGKADGSIGRVPFIFKATQAVAVGGVRWMGIVEGREPNGKMVLVIWEC